MKKTEYQKIQGERELRRIIFNIPFHLATSLITKEKRRMITPFNKATCNYEKLFKEVVMAVI